MTHHQLNIIFEHTTTDMNVEADWLSRGRYDLFEEYMIRVHKIHKFTPLKVPPRIRDLTGLIKVASEHPGWIVPDGPV